MTDVDPPMQIIQSSSEKADMLSQISPELIVDIIRNRLLGKDFIDGQWKDIDVLKERSLTERGAWDISNLMLPVSSKNVSISKLSDHEIRQRSLHIANTALIMCVRNWKEYGIKGTDQLWMVHQMVFSNTFITLKQPEGEGIRKLLMGTTSESRVVNTMNENKGGGLRGLFRR